MTIGITALVLNAAYAECHYTESHYAECYYAECHYGEFHYPEFNYAECHYAECHMSHVVVPYLNVCLTFYSNYCSMTNENVKHQSLNEMSQLIPTMFCNLWTVLTKFFFLSS